MQTLAPAPLARQHPHRWLRWRGLPLLVLAVGLGATLALWRHELNVQRQHLREAFDVGLRAAGQGIEQRMAAHEHLLQGLGGLIEAYPQADAAALRRYIEALPLGADFAGVQGLGLALLRGERAPLVQLEPAVGRNQALLGQDLLAEPARRRALEAARDSGRLALSARVLLADGRVGFWMALPVYRGREDEPAPQSLGQRRERLRAWVVAPVVVQELMASLYGELPAGLALSLHDGHQGDGDERLLYRAGRALEGTTLLRGQEFLMPGGHTWTLGLEARPAFAHAHGSGDGRAVLAVGATLSLLLALLAWQLATARERALALAERMTEALRESERRWAFALEGAGDGLWDWRPAAGAINASARGRALMGLEPAEEAEIGLAQMLERVHADDLPSLQAELQRCQEGTQPGLACEYRVADGAGGWRWVLARATVAERAGAEPGTRALRVIGTLSDISARRHSEEQVRFMALHDPLTELANRAHFGERLHFALANARRYNEVIGLILLDLDRFKPVNDTHGHAVGDLLLQTVARRLKGSVRETDTVGRIGGDEFVVLLTGPLTREAAQLVADKIFNQVAQPMDLGGLHLEITCSLGLALYPEDGQDELALTKAADDAMYRNKRDGRQLLGGEPRRPAPSGGGGVQ